MNQYLEEGGGRGRGGQKGTYDNHEKVKEMWVDSNRYKVGRNKP